MALISHIGADHIITLDLHDPQFQGYFDCPVDNLSSLPIMIKYIQHNIPDFEQAVIVSPDAGGAKRYKRLVQLGCHDSSHVIHIEQQLLQKSYYWTLL